MASWAYGCTGFLWVVSIGMEITTIFLNFVFFAEKTGYPNLRTAMGAVMFLLYIPLRICFSPMIVYALYSFWGEFSRLPALFVAWMVTMTVLGTAMNYFWFYKIGVGAGRGVNRALNARRPAAPSFSPTQVLKGLGYLSAWCLLAVSDWRRLPA